MKTVKKLTLLCCLTISLCLQSCQDDELPGNLPGIVLKNGSGAFLTSTTELLPEATLDLSIEVTANNSQLMINEVNVYKQVGGDPEVLLETIEVNESEITLPYEYIAIDKGTITLRFEAVSNNNQKMEVLHTVLVVEPVPTIDIDFADTPVSAYKKSKFTVTMNSGHATVGVKKLRVFVNNEGTASQEFDFAGDENELEQIGTFDPAGIEGAFTVKFVLATELAPASYGETETSIEFTTVDMPILTNETTLDLFDQNFTAGEIHFVDLEAVEGFSIAEGNEGVIDMTYVKTNDWMGTSYYLSAPTDQFAIDTYATNDWATQRKTVFYGVDITEGELTSILSSAALIALFDSKTAGQDIFPEYWQIDQWGAGSYVGFKTANGVKGFLEITPEDVDGNFTDFKTKTKVWVHQ